ncbi:hypothetical protein J2Y69_002170 [Microbacterium resistens]|uniref:PH domain-containing protein n=1 Tax=Microbacterium resistens TaxID=156977 RepID=A0ABU1SD83_9MICO|nr:hypothetical protein [Microbacterium resistens]MDR6867566.1 hypothetical protein [Microbacterium resistens]
MEISYRQPRRRLILVLGLAYLALFLTLAIVFFDRASELVNGAGSVKGIGLVVGAIALAPLIAIFAFATRRVEIRQDATTLTVRTGREETHIRRRDIARLTVNEPRVGTIRLLAADGGLLGELSPRPKEFPQVVGLIQEDGSFTEIERRTAFRGRVNVVTYARR